ncbi:MAG: DNA repair protein RadC [Lachnospiraceae bacterium]|nr:DNA repair protein RadC [Lachnospiraceae bacterium]
MKQENGIKSLAPEERPYEKCERYGVSSLSNIELLAILLRNGTKGESSLNLAKRILYNASSGDGLLSLHDWSSEQLLALNGIGRVKTIQIMSLLELAKRLAMARAESGLNFKEPASIARYYMEDLRHNKQEVMKLLLLNSKNTLIDSTNIAKGTVNSSVITPRELFIIALQKHAVSIILMHNHPSGDPMPSKEDVLLTRRIYEAGAMLGVELLDHIVIGNNCYVSLREKGFL